MINTLLANAKVVDIFHNVKGFEKRTILLKGKIIATIYNIKLGLIRLLASKGD